MFNRGWFRYVGFSFAVLLLPPRLIDHIRTTCSRTSVNVNDRSRCLFIFLFFCTSVDQLERERERGNRWMARTLIRPISQERERKCCFSTNEEALEYGLTCLIIMLIQREQCETLAVSRNTVVCRSDRGPASQFAQVTMNSMRARVSSAIIPKEIQGDAMPVLCIGGFLFYDERENERLIKLVRVFVGHIETNKCVCPRRRRRRQQQLVLLLRLILFSIQVRRRRA